MLIFNRSYELIEVMSYRSYEVISSTKSTNLWLICDRSYEVSVTIYFLENQMLGTSNYSCN